MSVATWLEQDHAVIKPVVAALDALPRPPKARFPLGVLDAVNAFWGGFVITHNQKEDHVLLPVLRECGVPVEEEPLLALRRDHEEVARQLALQAVARVKDASIWEW
jgi:iron-sulfur cluster repair protein YtfE (RIC family)